MTTMGSISTEPCLPPRQLEQAWTFPEPALGPLLSHSPALIFSLLLLQGRQPLLL